MALTDTDIANIIFNETRSLSGNDIHIARKNIANAIVNGAALLKNRPATGPTKVSVPAVEKGTYEDCVQAVADMRAERKEKIDSSMGATHFNFRKNNWRGDFYGKKICTQIGPLDNSYPTDDLPKSNIYANTYGP